MRSIRKSGLTPKIIDALELHTLLKIICKLTANFTEKKVNLRKKLTFRFFWVNSSLSELKPIIFHIELTHLGSEASIEKLNSY